MTVTYQLNEEDYRQALEAVSSNFGRWFNRIVTIVAAAVVLIWIVLGLMDSYSKAFTSLTPLATISIVVFVAMLFAPAAVRGTVKKQLRRSPSAKAPINLTVMEDGLRFYSEYTDSLIRWHSFIRWAEHKGVLALFTAPKFAHAVPKRAFDEPGLESFRSTLNSHLPARRP